jgi:hypothetical protein
MFFFFAVAVAGLYVTTARPGLFRSQEMAMIIAVAVLCVLGVLDNMKRRR